MPNIHLYSHSYKNLLSNYCMQIIVLCIWNALVNKVSLQSFVLITAIMMMTIIDIEIANNFIMLYMFQVMPCVLHIT